MGHNKLHGQEHTDSTDDIQDATASQKGLATSTQITKLDGIEALADVTDSTNVDSAGAVMEADFNANTILAADTDDTPTAKTIAVQQVVGRITAGNITGLTVAELWTLLGGKPTFVSQFSVGDSLRGNQTAYLNNFISSDTQSEAQSTFGKCRIKKLIVNIPSSTLNSSSTFQIEINGTPVGTAITYTASQTGRKTQVENITVATDDLLDVKVVLGGLVDNFIDIAEVTVVFEGVQ